MKKNGKYWLFFIAEILFLFVVPCVFIWLQYGDLTERYKVSVTAILLTLLIYWVFKRLIIDKWLKSIDQKIINIETNALSITDKSAIESNKKAWRRFSLLQLFLGSIMPILVFVLAIITIKTVEAGLIKLFGALVFCLISIIVGIIFRVLGIYSIKLAHEQK